VLGRIGHTQPRRIAARTVAERIAEELETPLGEVVGWKVRFTDQVGDTTLVKVMTDGVLLNEIVRDRLLRQYDTLIIDEAHERSLNIDFLLGYLARLLPRRPDLKLVITSATIDVDRIAKHFSADGAEVPIVEVSGRTYPVEVRYRPVVDPDAAEGDPASDPDRGPGDRDRRRRRGADRRGPGRRPGLPRRRAGDPRHRRRPDRALPRRRGAAALLPPLRRRPAPRVRPAHRAAGRAGHERRRDLADRAGHPLRGRPGHRADLPYSSRLKVQRLPIEPISQASARQRSGRCGRTSDGIAIRLYTQADFDSRPEYTDPEILRTSLASVLLQMAALELGDVADFPFIDPPDRRAVADGVALLEELGALDGDGALTPTGRTLAALPLDPRMARMVVEAAGAACWRRSWSSRPG
jgi:ATP-dependent helicase HrpA